MQSALSNCMALFINYVRILSIIANSREPFTVLYTVKIMQTVALRLLIYNVRIFCIIAIQFVFVRIVVNNNLVPFHKI